MIKTNKIIIFQPTYSRPGSQVAGAYPDSSEHKEKPTLDRHLPTQGYSHPHPHSLRQGQCRHTNSPHMHVFGLWEETRVPGRKPTQRWAMGKLHTDSGPIKESIFFLLLNVIRKQRYSRTYYTVFVSVYCLNLFWYLREFGLSFIVKG